MTVVLFILGIVFLFILPPLGIILLIIAVIALIFKIIGGTGKVAINTGKFISKIITTKKCPYCYSQVDAKAKVCPLCHKDITQYNNVETSTKKIKEMNNESYSENFNQQNIINENNTIYEYEEETSAELSKIYNLYKNEIYNEEEYRSKKEKWIESLKLLNFHNAETDFLNEMLPYIKDGVLEKSELGTIKYIVSGEYEKDQFRKIQEQKIKSEEERKIREESINNIKNKTKEMISSTINKISSIVSNNANKRIHVNERYICECGEKLEEDTVFCANCGKKLK